MAAARSPIIEPLKIHELSLEKTKELLQETESCMRILVWNACKNKRNTGFYPTTIATSMALVSLVLRQFGSTEEASSTVDFMFKFACSNMMNFFSASLCLLSVYLINETYYPDPSLVENGTAATLSSSDLTRVKSLASNLGISTEPFNYEGLYKSFESMQTKLRKAIPEKKESDRNILIVSMWAHSKGLSSLEIPPKIRSFLP